MPTPTERLLDKRDKTHGDWTIQAACARDIKAALLKHGLLQLPPGVGEALDMIAVKMSRIMTGDWGFPDHWDDISGYAMCGKEAAEKIRAPSPVPESPNTAEFNVSTTLEPGDLTS